MLEILLAVLILAVIIWILNTYIPLPGPIRVIVNLLVIIVALLWVVRRLGVNGP